jgi:hypothetical protein
MPENVIFTALPNGVHESGDFLRLTVFVSPRLSTGGGLRKLRPAQFQAFANWPETLADMKFAAAFDGASAVSVEAKLDPDSATANPETWSLLFGQTSVREGGFTDHSKRRVLSVPVATVSQSVLDLYTTVAETSPTVFPPVTIGPLADLADELGGLGARDRHYPELDKRIGEGRYLDRTSIPPARRQQLAFVEAYRFYDRPGSRDPRGPRMPPPAPKVTATTYDFHAFVAFCGDYPKLLRPLGLAIDLLVRLDPAIPGAGRVRIEVGAPPAFEPWMTTEEARPWTRYEIVDRRFLPEPREKEGDLVDGMLRLEFQGRFLVNQIDVDGSALKTVDFAGNVQRVREHLSGQQRSMTQDASSVPALRSVGFTIARDGRAASLVHHLDKAADHDAKHASGVAAELSAEDVNRGYRLDVEDSRRPNRWLSLHRRSGSYNVEPQGGGALVSLPIDPDEAYVKAASASSVPRKDDLYLHEALVGWEGWSLAAKRPGLPITNTGAEPIPSKNPTSFPLTTEFAATPGTLPRLRYGRTYRFRIRAVDLAGNSVPEEDVVPAHVTVAQTFRRFDPVPSPVVVPRRPFTEGESLLRMVIRSTLGVHPPDYVKLARVVGLDGHTDPLLAYLTANERHLAPPLSSQQLAEWHGMFDSGIGVNATPAQVDEQFDVSARESGSFLDPTPQAFVFNPDPAATPTKLDDPKRHKGDPLKPGEYVCHDTNHLELPYLPDPLSPGVSLTTVPGDATTRRVRWEGGSAWYDRQPFLLRIEDGSGAPVYDAAKRLLTVFLPQAEMVTVRLASFLEPAALDLMGVWMLEQEAIRALQRPDALRGLHWMLTPWQPLTLVHAVEKPLAPPHVDVPPGGVERDVGETFAVLTGAVGNHAKSTGRLDLEASWTEPVDDVIREAPSTLTAGGHVADFQLEGDEDDCRIGRDDLPAATGKPAVHKVRHEFRDTKHRWVRYRAIATTRFREYFPSEITNDPALITYDGPEVLLDVPSSRRPEPPEVLYVVPTWTWQNKLRPGVSVKGRSGRAVRLLPTSLRTRSGGGLRVYLDRPWYSSGDDELLGVVLAHQPWLTWPIDAANGLEVSATARALADEFAERALAEELVKPGGRASASPSERLLAGVRRAGRPRAAAPKAGLAPAEAALAAHEMMRLEARSLPAKELSAAHAIRLGALIAKMFEPTGDPRKFVTHWGLDPIWGSAPIDPGPYIHQFPLRAAVGHTVSLLEAPRYDVTVVGHEPRFDEVRKLWYCDLQLDAGAAYYPFVRLALARYQPHSIPGQHLSAVVFPEFAQLVTERTSAVTLVGSDAVAVSLSGPAAFTAAAEWLVAFGDPRQVLELSRFVVAQVERRRKDTDTDLAWMPVGDEVRLSLSAKRGLGDVRYAGTVPLPPRDDSYELRLALHEYEIFETDESEAEEHFVRQLPLGDFAVLDAPVRYRLVYADRHSL